MVKGDIQTVKRKTESSPHTPVMMEVHLSCSTDNNIYVIFCIIEKHDMSVSLTEAAAMKFLLPKSVILPCKRRTRPPQTKD